jgi:DNA (cytosine-5)-methyltransferase 1
MPRSYYSVDLFAGAGGLTEGFRQVGVDPLVATDLDSPAAATFRANFPDVPFLERPIEDVPGKELLRTAGLRRGELDVLLGGPPCQAFSVYNHQRGFHDERSGLFREYLRVVEELRPKVIVMENVTGMKDLGNGRAIREIHQRLGKLGYQVEDRTLKSEEYGVPQERRRIFFIGTRLNGPIQWPEVTHGSGSELFDAVREPFVTVGDAISDLPLIESGEGRDEVRPYTRQPRSDYQREMRRDSPGVANHEAPRLEQINMERMKHIPPGGSWRDLPWKLLPPGMKRARRSDHTKRYGRLHPKGLASTILTKCDPHWGAYFHPEQDRAISVREAARLQSFPDRLRFLGPRGEQYRQVGNAVPPLLARAVAESVLEMLAAADSRRNRTAVAV